MIKIFLAVTCSCFIFSFSISQKIQFKAVTVIASSFIPLHEGYTDSNTIFYAPNMIIYKMHRHYNTSAIRADEEGNMTKTELLESGELLKYFVYNLGEKYGIMFNTDNIINKSNYDTTKERKILIDSFLKHNYFNLDFDLNLFKTDSIKLITTSSENYNRIETYIIKSKKIATAEDSVILYFNTNFMDVDYSLSKNKENQFPFKLQKIKMIYNIGEDKQLNIKFLKRERIYELRKVNPKEFKDAIYYYELAKKKL